MYWIFPHLDFKDTIENAFVYFSHWYIEIPKEGQLYKEKRSTEFTVLHVQAVVPSLAQLWGGPHSRCSQEHMWDEDTITG